MVTFHALKSEKVLFFTVVLFPKKSSMYIQHFENLM